MDDEIFVTTLINRAGQTATVSQRQYGTGDSWRTVIREPGRKEARTIVTTALGQVTAYNNELDRLESEGWRIVSPALS